MIAIFAFDIEPIIRFNSTTMIPCDTTVSLLFCLPQSRGTKKNRRKQRDREIEIYRKIVGTGKL